MKGNLISATFAVSVVSFFFLSVTSNAAQEILKTSKVRVGEKAPLAGSIKKAIEEEKAVVVTLMPNPVGCKKCDDITTLIQDEAAENPDMVFILKGGQDMLGAIDEDTVILKRSLGFVTMGEAWTYLIDADGVLRKILIGPFGRNELKEMLGEIKRRKE